MTTSIQQPPAPLKKSRFHFFYLLLIYPAYTAAYWWSFNYDIDFSWQQLFQPATLWTLGSAHLLLGCGLLAWQVLRLRSGYSKLKDCSDYEGYLNNLFDNRERHRPAQNASRLEVVRKMRSKNNTVRTTAENYQRNVYLIVHFATLVMMIGGIMQLVSHLI